MKNGDLFILEIKNTPAETEKVFVRNFERNQNINFESPQKSFPYSSKENKVFIVPIYPEYHTELFPDSILKTESPKIFVENEPHRNALSKVYISRSHFKDLKSGDLIVFYRTGGIYAGVATTIGIVESVIDNIPDEEIFIRLCRKEVFFSDVELKSTLESQQAKQTFYCQFFIHIH